MATNANIISLIGTPVTSGYVVYLGYSTTSIVGANQVDGTCFGSFDPNNISSYTGPSNITNTYTSTPFILANGTNIPANQAILAPETPVFNTADNTVGFYGFAYVVGDPSADGFDPSECGDIECFEIEVVESLQTDNYPTSGAIIQSWCEGNIPSTFTVTNTELPNLDLTKFTITSSCPLVTSITGMVLALDTTQSSGTCTLTFTENTSATHDLDPGCCPSGTATTGSFTVTLDVSTSVSAGVGGSIAVCN